MSAPDAVSPMQHSPSPACRPDLSFDTGKRLRILHVSPSFWPATQFGGPIYSTFSLCRELAGMDGVSLRVLTTDTAGQRAADRLCIRRNATRFTPGFFVHYARKSLGRDMSLELLARLPGAIRKADRVMLTGIYSFPTLPVLLLCRLFGKPLVWSPRGTILAAVQWSGVRNRTLKKFFECLCRILAPQDTIVHVTSLEERAACEARLPGLATALVSNGVDLPEAGMIEDRLDQTGLRLMFIGRLDPKKGLDILIEAMGLLPRDTVLDVYGTGAPAYVAELKALACSLEVDARTAFHGHVGGDEKTRAFANADILVLTSHSENFGMSVAEALAHAVPVIVSRGTPWESVEKAGAGLWIDNNPAALADAVTRMAGGDLRAMGSAGREWMKRDFGWFAKAWQMLAVLRGETAPVDGKA